MQVTLDTNIWVSALNFGGRAARLIGMARLGSIEIGISDHIEEELLRVLREDFEWEGYRLHFLREQLAKMTRRVTPTARVELADDPDDNRIIECAVAAGSRYIISNDHALLRVKEYAGVLIVRLAEFLQRELPRSPQNRQPERR